MKRFSRDIQQLWRSGVSLAQQDDAQAIAELLNLAYRSGKGWTHEQQLVAGLRADESTVRTQLTASTGNYLLMWLERSLLACIHVAPYKNINGPVNPAAMIGSFAVHPDCQGLGLGAKLLNEAERYVSFHYAAAKFYMDVLAPRRELIAYYQRKGYEVTGERKPFPLAANAGVPVDAELQVIRLVKRVQMGKGKSVADSCDT